MMAAIHLLPGLKVDGELVLWGRQRTGGKGVKYEYFRLAQDRI